LSNEEVLGAGQEQKDWRRDKFATPDRPDHRAFARGKTASVGNLRIREAPCLLVTALAALRSNSTVVPASLPALSPPELVLPLGSNSTAMPALVQASLLVRVAPLGSNSIVLSALVPAVLPVPGAALVWTVAHRRNSRPTP
jgi:hypothetical protein